MSEPSPPEPPTQQVDERLRLQNIAEQFAKMAKLCPDCLWPYETCTCGRTDA